MKLQIAALSALLLLASAAGHAQDAVSVPTGRQDAKKHSVTTDRSGRPIASRFAKAGDAYR